MRSDVDMKEISFESVCLRSSGPIDTFLPPPQFQKLLCDIMSAMFLPLRCHWNFIVGPKGGATITDRRRVCKQAREGGVEGMYCRFFPLRPQYTSTLTLKQVGFFLCRNKRHAAFDPFWHHCPFPSCPPPRMHRTYVVLFSACLHFLLFTLRLAWRRTTYL